MNMHCIITLMFPCGWIRELTTNNLLCILPSVGFVAITPELHDEFDAFKEKLTTPTFPCVAPLDFWNRNVRPMHSCHTYYHEW